MSQGDKGKLEGAGLKIVTFHLLAELNDGSMYPVVMTKQQRKALVGSHIPSMFGTHVRLGSKLIGLATGPAEMVRMPPEGPVLPGEGTPE